MKARFLSLAKFFLFVLCFIALERFCHKQTRGFSLLKIASNSPESKEEILFDSEKQKNELESFFKQPFSYLNSGGQCYAFISADGKTILKFFKQHHLRTWRLLKSISLPSYFENYRHRLLEKKRHQSPQFLESCCIAYKEFKERTGLIYLHINRTNYFKKQVKIIDNLGIAHLVDLDITDFALQKRVQLFHPYFRKLIKENKIDIAKQCIDSTLGLIVERCQKGIYDRDPNIRRNVGFLDNKAIEMDLGSFTKEGELNYQRELRQITKKWHRWLTRENSELANYLIEKLNTYTQHEPSK